MKLGQLRQARGEVEDVRQILVTLLKVASRIEDEVQCLMAVLNGHDAAQQDEIVAAAQGRKH